MMTVLPRSRPHLLCTFVEYSLFPPACWQFLKQEKDRRWSELSLEKSSQSKCELSEKADSRDFIVILFVDIPSWKMDSFTSRQHMSAMLGDTCVWLPMLLGPTAGG